MKKNLFAFVLIIFTGFFSETLAVDYDNFPKTECESVKVIYLESEKPNSQGFKEYSFFEVNKNLDDEWQIAPEEVTRASIEKKKYVRTEKDKQGKPVPLDSPVEKSSVIQRFKFGTENYKKYCVGFQEAIPVGPQGGNAKSIGADSGIDLIKQYVSMIYKFGSMFIGLICVLVVVVSGVQMTMGSLTEGGFEAAKTRILQSLLSLVLLFGSAMILRTINPGFFT